MAATILDTIAARTRERVAEDKAAAPLEVVRERALELARAERAHNAAAGLVDAHGEGVFTYPFQEALACEGLSFICEAKKASPSKGVIAEVFEPVAIAQAYEAAGAAAISCLTEPYWFLGSDRYLEEVCAAVDIPVLRKDFTVDEYMIYQAKVLGASAVLLICAILDDEELARYHRIADELGLSVLVEAHDAEEVQRALAAGARIVGVNNRNLKDFSVDFANATSLRALIPEGVLYVAESGVTCAEDVAQIAATGADAVLVGEALMRADNVSATLAAFRQAANIPETNAKAPSFSQPKVKFCGVSQLEDVEAVNEVHPDYVGLVFWPQSKRVVDVEEAAALREALHDSIQTVGVFVDETAHAISDLAQRGIISVAQLHGREDGAFIERLRELAPDLEVWKAFEVRESADIQTANESSADLVLLDAGKGEGNTFDWSLLAALERPFALAGGLAPETIAVALASLPAGISPHLVDVSTGIESAIMDDAGRPLKDPHKMQQFKANLERKTMSKGRFGIHGGQYVPETLMNAVNELEEAYEHYKNDPEFQAELTELFNEYAGRPSRLYFAERMTEDLGGAKIYLKREDLNHTGAHKINNVLGQALLAKKMGKTRLIAETGAGQHGVATATAAALLGMECEVFMGREDTERQALNVYKMRLLGAQVHPVDSGTGTLKDAVSETMREWTNRVADTHYCLGSVMGPHPFPVIVRDFQAVISREIMDQCMEKEGRLPDAVLACVGGGSNAIGSFYHFIDHPEVRLIGCEAAGRGVDTFETAATFATGSLGIFHGMKSYFCQDEYGQIAPVYSISAGLDYPGIGPEHAHLHDIGRAEYVPITDDEAVEAFEYIARTEGIIAAIESSHALAYAMKLAPQMDKDQIMVVTISGRGDKDCAAIARYRGEDINE